MQRRDVQKFLLLWVVIFGVGFHSVVVFPADGSVGIRVNTNNYAIAPLNQTAYLGLSWIRNGRPYLKNNLPGYKRSVEIDSSYRYVIISEKFLDAPFFRLPAILPFSEYLHLRCHYENQESWRASNFEKYLVSQTQQGRAQGVGFDIPIPIKSQAFQRIFGGAAVGLHVTGNITIDGGLRHEKRSQVKTAYNRSSDYNFKMQQTQRFTVKGNVGRKVHVFVDQDSERPFEFENSIRLEYKGFEDEIIESIEAGNVALSLPATRFVTFSGKNSGLFGIKANMHLGNLKLTTIASQEKGEKKKLSITGGSSEDKHEIQDYQYRRGTYFFLNKEYRENFKHLDENGNHLYDPSRVISRIEVYKSESRYENQAGSIRGWAIAYPEGANPQNPDTTRQDQEHYRGYFLRMEPTADYFVDRELGYIALETPLQEGQVLAVAYRDTSGNQVGDIDFVDTGNNTIILQLLRPRVPLPSDYTWDLEWRNVYYLGAKNIDKNGFELKIYRKRSGLPEETQLVNGKPVSYLQIFGLDKRDENGDPNPDNILDDDPNIINWARGELIFPDLRPFDPEGPTLLDSTKRVPAIYDTTDNRVIAAASNFYISVKAKIRQTTYNLGWNVIENSEEVILNGRRLSKGKDYIIDYTTGNLTLLAEEATDPNARLEITYESNQILQIDRRTLMGMRWDYELPNNSFIGGTLLYLSQSTLDQKIRVGRGGPMRNLVWDLNTALNFEPAFLTHALDALPIVQTKAPSKLQFEAELAQIIPNPNTQNNPATGDNNGVAYIDDFEPAKRETPLGIMQAGWAISSVPAEIDEFPGYNDLADATKNESRGFLLWYNPYEQVPIAQIWPEKAKGMEEATSATPRVVHVLHLKFEPKVEYGTHSWGGIMRALPAGYADQTTSKFLEVWVQGDAGRLHIDFGQISEDAIPNGALDTEDLKRNGIRNGYLDDDEDVGLDGVAGPDPPDPFYPHEAATIQIVNGVKRATPYDFWDLNGDMVKQPSEPWSYDDWHYAAGNANNGTEGNANGAEGRFPDTEDLNQNGDVDLRNSYFEYSFSLDKTSPDTVYIAGGQNNPYGWRLYRIPLSKVTKIVGNPQWSLIEYVRIWVDGFSTENWLRIAEINLVGNEWQELGVALSDTSDYDANNDTTVAVTVVNTHENPDYTPPPGVSGVRDRISNVVAKEQALVLKVENLPPGANGIIHKTFFQPVDFRDYNKMKMFIYGKDPFGTHIREDSSWVELIFRFGYDEKNYYEFRERVYPKWDKRNEMVIDFVELTALKLADSTSCLDAQGHLFRELPDGKLYRVVGTPSISRIKELVVGVKNLHGYIPFNGEIWLNELRLTDVKKDKGMAMRVRAEVKLADIGSINAEFNRIDADFHTVNERFGKKDDRSGISVNGRFSLEKFLPNNGLGLSIPISVGYSNSESTPKYFPGSDIIVSQRTISDSLLETIKNINNRSNLSISLKKARRSRNPIFKYTIDNMELAWSMATSRMSNPIYQKSTNRTNIGSFNYDLRIDATSHFKPFGWLGNKPILNKLTGIEFYYLPKKVSYKISTNRAKNFALNRNGMEKSKYNFIIDQRYAVSMQPFKSVSVDFSRSCTNDLRKVQNPAEILKGNFGVMTGIKQQINSRYSPNLFSWLSINFTYGTTFSWDNNIQQKKTGQRASVNNNLSSSLTFTPKSLFKKLTGRTRKPKRTSTIPPRRFAEKKKHDKKLSQKLETKEQEKKTEEKNKALPKIDFLKLFRNLFSKIQPISIRYSQRRSSNNFGLQGVPCFAYQIGKTFNPGAETATSVGFTSRSSQGLSYDLSAQTSISVTRNLSISLKYNYNNSSTSTTQTTGTITETRLKIKDKYVNFPDWTVRWSGLEKLALFGFFADRVSLDHSRTGRKVTKWYGKKTSITGESFDCDFRPFLGLTMVLKKGINVNLQYNKSSSETMSRSGGKGGSRHRNENFMLTVNYSKSGGFKIPLPIWPFKNKKIQNNMDFSMSVIKSKDINEIMRGEHGTYVETACNEKWSIAPKLTYSFSSTVRGGVHFEIGKNKSKLAGETAIKEFGINVNISITGR